MVHYSWQPVPKGIIGTVICPFKPATLQKPTVNPIAPVVAPTTNGIPAPPPGGIPAAPPQAPPLAPQAPIFDPLLMDRTSTAGPYQVPLEIGDSVYILEEYTETESTFSKHKKKSQASWYRGYVFQCANSSATKPLMGIFPANYVYTSYGKDNFDDENNRNSVLSMKRVSTIKERDEDEVEAVKEETIKEEDEIIPEDEEANITKYRNRNLNNNEEEDDNDALPKSGMQRKKTLGNSADLRVRAWMMKKHIHQPLPASIEPTHTTTAGQDEILVDEIASTLREWGILLKQYLKQQKYDLFTQIRELFQILFQGRRQLLARTLSEEELTHLRRELIQKMEEGNRLQNLDIILRDPNSGKIIDVRKDNDIDENDTSHLSVLQIYRMHIMKLEEEEEFRANEKSVVVSNNSANENLTNTNANTAASATANNNTTNVGTNGPSSAIITSNSTSAVQYTTGPASAPAQNSYNSNSIGYNNPITNTIVSKNKVRISYTPLNLLSPNSHLDELATKFSHLFFQFHQCNAVICAPNEYSEFSAALFNKAENRFVSETFIFRLNAYNQPYSEDKDFAQLRTLFVDLSHRDLNDNIYLVIKIIRIGRMTVSEKDVIKDNTSSNGNGTSTSNINSPITPNNNTGTISFRRPYGCAVMELGNILLNKQEIRPEYTLRVYVPTTENNFSTIHENVINQNNIGYEPRSSSITISLAVFNGNAAVVIKENKALFASTAITPRHGFSDIILPGDFRNALYLTLVSGDFQQGRKASGRNICVNVRIRMNNGNFIPNCIRRGSGGENISEYESIVYYHCNQPKWQETIRIDMAAESFENAHILFLFRYCSSKEKITDRSDKIFGYAFLPLVRRNNTVINDSLHNIPIYRYDKKLEHPSVYLLYQANIQANKEDYSFTNAYAEINNNNTNIFSTSSSNNTNSIAEQASHIVVLKDTLNIRTALCSTKLTQNVALLNLLHWEEASNNDMEKLSTILKEFTLIGELEIIKFLKDILEALFSILACELNNDGKLNDLVMSGLVFTLSIVMDKRFTNHRPFVDGYIIDDKDGFHFSSVWQNLITAFHKLLSDPVSPSSAKEIRNAIKVQQYLFKFIIQSHALFYVKEIDHQPDEVLIQFKNDLKNRLNIIFESFNKMMELTEPDAIIGSQTLTLQYMPTLIPDLLVVYSKYELSEIVIDFIDSTKNNKSKIVGYKLTFIYHLLCSPLYNSMESRKLLTKAIIRWITEYINREWVLPVSYSKSSTKNVSGSVTVQNETGFSSNSNVNLLSSINSLNSIITNALNANLTLANLIALYGSDNLRLCFLVIAELIDRFSYPDTETDDNEYGQDGESITNDSIPAHHKLNQKPISPIVIMDGLLPKILNIYSNLLINKRAEDKLRMKLERRKSPAQIIPTTSYTELSELTMIILVLFCNLTDKEVAHFFLSQYKKGDEEKDANCNVEGGGFENVNILLTQLFIIFESMLTTEQIPTKWVVPNILMHKIIVRVMRPISGLMRYMFIPKKNGVQNTSTNAMSSGILKKISNSSFNSELWHNFFNVLISLLNSPYVQIEKFPPQKRRASAILNGDIRETASEMLLKMWKYLNINNEENYQNIFIPNMVGPMFELSMSPNNSVRAASIEILYNMIENEYNMHHHFNSIQVECIDKMDRLVMGEGKGDESYRRFFIDALDAKLSSSNTPIELRDSGLQFLSSMDEFLRLMLCVRDLTELGKDSSNNSLWETERMQGTLKLMKWMKVIDSKNIYLKHVYNLYEMHKNNQNFIEAGYALKLHADLLEWNSAKKLEPMPEYGFDTEESSFERKEKLYYKIIDCFESSKAWEKAIQLCKELAYQYETITLNYSNISELLKKEAKLYECIATEDRYFSNYFRVGFYGAKWHSMIRNKQFVYRGIEWEKIGPFCERIVNKYPNSQLLRSNQPPDRDIKYGDILYIQITAIQPEPSWEHWIANDDITSSIGSLAQTELDYNSVAHNLTTKLMNEEEINVTIDPNSDDIIESAEYSILDNYPDYIRKYYEANEVRTFSFNRPFKKQKDKKTNSENEFMDLWTEKTILITENKFPSLLRRSEVIYLKIIELSPIENAVLTLIAKNRELNMAKERYEKAEDAIKHGQEIPTDMRLVTGGVNINPLTMLLNGSVDARVNGGVPMYRNAFLCPEFLEQNPEYDYLINKMRKLIEQQAIIIHEGLELHDRLVTPEMRPLHENLIKSFNVTFENEIKALHLPSFDTKQQQSTATTPLPQTQTSVPSQNSSQAITIPSTAIPAKLGSDRHSSFTLSATNIYSTLPRHHRDKSETGASPLNNLKKEQQQFNSLTTLPQMKNGSIKTSYKKRMSNNSLESNPSSYSHAKLDSQASDNGNLVNMNSISEVNTDEKPDQ
ncbi:hypothetical protein BCR36DRAFT_409280 [Piromyces finnis]|uniref:Uncharacterized protein n=1 Tax=Piromyces finnis TaxID=1754191 RepID=A0A1Y1VJC7_9FUNG|nr:hypothetical protein BCR36DRAFT_409280 [Piromyces finnis]|eukprot:ORX57813.1 hypothetical protein BCR36DRAFT_409280 [Piromyces finnis]